MTANDGSIDTGRSVLVLTGGTFGEKVGERLHASHGASVRAIGPSGTHPSIWPYFDLIVLATGHERNRVAELIDRTAFAWKRPWFPVHSSATALYCGPVVIPGRTACHRCFVGRREQHRASSHHWPTALYDVEVAHPTHHVGIAAALAQQAINEAFDGPPVDSLGATVRMFDQISGAVSANAVVAGDRCPRCRTTPDSRNELVLWRALAAAASSPVNSAQAQQEATQR